VIKPEVVVGNAHFVKCDLFGIFEEAVGSPDVVQPLDVQNAVLLLHVLRQAQPGVTPSLCQENVRDVSLPEKCASIKILRGERERAPALITLRQPAQLQ
jgi:hypothetical protein